jgi:hypothetical protein
MDPNKLKSILSGAKAVMDAVDGNHYQKGNIDPTRLSTPSDNLVESVPMGGYEQPMMQEPVYQPQPYRNLHTTKMPKEIVQAMLENPISTPDTPFHTFELTEDFLSEINPTSKRTPQPQKIQQQKSTNPVQRLAETKRNSVMNLTEDEVRRIVREEMQDIIFDYFDQRVIKEDIQIKVGSTIFSGKLSPLPSKKTTKRK